MSQSEIMQQLAVPRFTPRPKPTVIPTAAWNEAPLFCLQINDEWVSHILGALEVLDQSDTWIGTEEEIASARQQVNEIMLAFMQRCPPRFYSFWDEPAPDTIDSEDGSSVALGLKFRTSIAGNVHGLRFYKSLANTGPHTGYLFSSEFASLGGLTFADETADGWQTAYFDEPIAIEACQTYIASYHAPNGHYSYSRPFFTDGYNVPPLYAKKSVEGDGNGTYAYGDAGTPPDNSYLDSNYWIDVIFEPTGADYLE